MAARQRRTRHLVGDGVYAAWDSSEVDENLRRQLLERAEGPLGELAEKFAASPAPRKARTARRRKAKAARAKG